MRLDAEQLSPAFEIPDADHAILAGGGQLRAAGAEAGGAEAGFLTGKLPYNLFRAGIQQIGFLPVSAGAQNMRPKGVIQRLIQFPIRICDP